MNHDCGKRSWPTEEMATKALERIWHRQRPGGRRMETRAYQCPDCRHFHLTSKPDEWTERPSHAELWRRQQLALSLLADNGPLVLEQIRQALTGEVVKDGAA